MSESKKILWDDLSSEMQQTLMNLATRDEAGSVAPTEFQQMMGQIYYFLKDDVIEKMMQEDARLKPLLAGVSSLLRTSRQDNPTMRAQMKLRWKRALRLQLLILNQKVEMSDLALFDVMVNFGYGVIEDQNQGWRGKLAAERVKTYKMEGAGQKKKGWLERLGLK